MRTMSDHSKAYLAIGIAMVSVSFASILIKWSETPPFVLAAYRLAFAAAILAPFMLLTGGFSEIKRFSRQELALVLVSGLALTFHFGLWVVSLGLTLVSTSVILVTSHPIFVAAVQHFLMKEPVRKAAVVGIVIAFSGVVLISITDYRLGGGPIAGDAFAFVGGLCAGVYFLSGRVARRTLSVAPYAFSVYALAAALLFVSGAIAGDVLVVTDARELALFVLMAIVPTIFGHTMFNYALKKVPAHIISTSVLGEPVGASLLAYLLLPGEVPTVWIVLGGALVVGGLYLVLRLGYDRNDG